MSKKKYLKIDVDNIEHNIYYKDNPENFMKLKEIVEKNPTSYHKILNAKGYFKSDGSFCEAYYAYLNEWASAKLRSNGIETISTSQQVFMILYGLDRFPKCKNAECNNDLHESVVSLFEGKFRQDFCCKTCADQGLKKVISMSKASIQKRSFDQRLCQMNEIDQLKFLVGKYPGNYPAMICSREWLLKFVDELTPLLQSNEYIMPTKIFWIFNNISSWDDDRVRCHNPKCKKPLTNRNVIGSTFPKYCSSKCAMSDIATIDKIRSTSIMSYGCSWPSSNYQAQKKSKAMYELDGFNFKSSWEVAFYVYHKDNGDDITYTPECSFQYIDANGKQHSYFPDFLLNGKLIEIKGNQFISKDNTLINPYDRSQDSIYEAKHQCMISNGVMMLTANEVKPLLEYVRSKYGKTFMDNIRRKSKKV